MTHLTKTALLTLLATLILAGAIGTATALRLSTSAQTIRATWTSLEMANTITTNTIRCPVTLEGSFHSATIAKTIGALVGYLTRASVRGAEGTGSCTGGSLTLRTERLPWHIRYRGYSGELPRITLLIIGLIGASWSIHTGSFTCDSTTEASEPAIDSITIDRETGRVETLTPERNARIALEGGFCGLGRGSFGGASQQATQLGSTATITVRLI